MSHLIPFEFKGHAIRVQVDDDGKPWWYLAECAEIVGISDVHRAAARIDVEDRRKTPELTQDGKYRDVWFINDSGLYTLLLRSNKPEARVFRRWVTSEVLPAIRKTGHYEVEPAPPSAIDDYHDLRAIVQLVESVAEARKEIEAIRRETAQATEKADLALHNQQWLTIREYVYLYKLRPQFPESMWADFGRYLTGYCLEQGVPVRQQEVADRRYATEHAYHIEVIHTLLPPWLTRRGGQGGLTLLPVK